VDGGGVGRTPYQVALRLYAIAEERWAEVDAAYPSVDLLRLPIHRFLNYVYAWCLERVEAEKLEQWRWEMNQPLPGREKDVTDAQVEEEGRGFMDLMTAMGGAV
jgi:hypothetical protein